MIGPGAVARVTKQVRQRIRQRMLGVIRVAHLILRRDHAGIRGKLRVERCRREEDRRVVIPEIHALLLQPVEIRHILRRHEPVVDGFHHDQDQVLARKRAGHQRVGRLLRVGRVVVVQLRDPLSVRRRLRPDRHDRAAHRVLVQTGEHQAAVGVGKLRIGICKRVVALGIVPCEILTMLHGAALGHQHGMHGENTHRTRDRQHGGHDPAAAAGARLRREDHGAEHQRETHGDAQPLPHLEVKIRRADKPRAVASISEIGKGKARARQLIEHAVRDRQQRKRHERDQQEDAPPRPRQQRSDRRHRARPQQGEHQRLPRPERHVAHRAIEQAQGKIQKKIRQKSRQQAQPQRGRAQPPRTLDRRRNGCHGKHPFGTSGSCPLKYHKNI